jgi:hypothetical protein
MTRVGNHRARSALQRSLSLSSRYRYAKDTIKPSLTEKNCVLYFCNAIKFSSQLNKGAIRTRSTFACLILFEIASQDMRA